MGRIQIQSAPNFLTLGAVGVAEDHRVPDGRALAIELIAKGLVQVLFLECKRSYQRFLDNAVQRGDLNAVRWIVNAAGVQYENLIDVGDVAAAAVRSGVQVHLIDQEKQYGDIVSMANRDEFAAKHFNQITAARGNTAHCLVLFGAGHFGVWHKTHGIYRCLAQWLNLDYVVCTRWVQMGDIFESTGRAKHMQVSLPPRELGAGKLRW
jgi:hypothetical protein